MKINVVSKDARTIQKAYGIGAVVGIITYFLLRINPKSEKEVMLGAVIFSAWVIIINLIPGFLSKDYTRKGL